MSSHRSLASPGFLAEISMTTKALTVPTPFELDVAREPDYGPELTEDDLACVVGGLARAWSASLDEDRASDHETPTPR
jgi:hypothetical protein